MVTRYTAVHFSFRFLVAMLALLIYSLMAAQFIFYFLPVRHVLLFGDAPGDKGAVSRK